MYPTFAIVGRPNVGKSTLFNRLTRSRNALVLDIPGVTRDRQYGEGHFENQTYILIDTGGIVDDQVGIDRAVIQQSFQAMQEAQALIFLVEAKSGLTTADQVIAEKLRRMNKPIYLVVNKIDGVNPDLITAEFHALGMGHPLGISAAHGRGMEFLQRTLLAKQSHIANNDLDAVETEKLKGIRVAIVGQPNVGKSTLINRILGEERVIVYDQPGTTRDSILIPLERHGKPYVLIDTAGVRRRRSVYETLEKFSVVKTLQAIEAAHVVIMLIDAHSNIAEQDLHLLGFIVDAGKALVIAVNKWDGMEIEARDLVRKDLDRRLTFANFAKVHFISAKYGTEVGNLFPSIEQAYHAATKTLSTPDLNRVLSDAVAAHHPPISHGRRIKLRYAHMGGRNPPRIVIHGNQTEALPDAYRRYLINTFRTAFNLVGTPIQLEFKSSDNPFKNKKNTLTPRQLNKRRRIRGH